MAVGVEGVCVCGGEGSTARMLGFAEVMRYDQT